MEIKKQLVANRTWGKYETWLNEDLVELFPIRPETPFHEPNKG